MNMARLKGEKKKRREKEIYGICSIEIVSFTDDRIFPEVRFEWTMEKWRIRIRRTARGAEQYIFETRFPANGRKKRTMSCSGEARFRVLIIQHTPNKWASFLESTVASRQSNALRLLVAHLMISRRPYGESFCHQSKSPGTKLHDLRTNSSRHEPILILYTVVIG